MGDILKEAIADAKAVRETALANAKMALEEAFTPQLKSMLSAKLKEDDLDAIDLPDDEEEEFPVAPEDVAIPAEDEDAFGAEAGAIPGEEEEFPIVPAEEGGYEEQEDEFGGEEEFPAAPVAPEEEVPEDELDLEAIIRELEAELGGEYEDEEEVEEPPVEETISLNGKTYRVVNEEDDAYDEKASADRDGLAEEDDAYDEKASADRDGLAEQEEDDDEEIDIPESFFYEQSDSSDIGKGDNKVDVADAGDEEDPGKGELSESYYKERLAEYREAVSFLKDKLHEVNILNAKLLFTNKLFKEFSLNNNQKLKVVETFDRTQSTREIKLVYATLAEQFGDNTTIKRKKSIKESASAKSGSTRPTGHPKKVISEEANVANRFKKLAGLL